MPLILLFGQLRTGKQKLTDELIKICDEKKLQYYEISPKKLNFAKDELISRQSELNRSIYHQTRQFLSRQCIVIVNYSNHLKSLRYELFCIAREKKTPSCILATYDVNYTPQTPLEENLNSRFEYLIQQSDWDSPVFNNATDTINYVCSENYKKSARNSTRVARFKQIPLFDLVNSIVQRIYQQQSLLGDVCNVQFFDDVYFTCNRKFELRELQKVAGEFKLQYKGDNDNYEQAKALKALFEKQQ